jgi:hypothetical protein
MNKDGFLALNTKQAVYGGKLYFNICETGKIFWMNLRTPM